MGREQEQQNLLKHAIRFETAALTFEDPYMLAEKDPSWGDEERWNTLGSVAPKVVLFVVHTWFEVDGEEVIRIISARAAESREREEYEEAHPGARRRHRRRRGHER